MKCKVLKKCYRNGRLYERGSEIDLPEGTKLGTVFKPVEVKAPVKRESAKPGAGPSEI